MSHLFFETSFFLNIYVFFEILFFMMIEENRTKIHTLSKNCRFTTKIYLKSPLSDFAIYKYFFYYFFFRDLSKFPPHARSCRHIWPARLWRFFHCVKINVSLHFTMRFSTFSQLSARHIALNTNYIFFHIIFMPSEDIKDSTFFFFPFPIHFTLLLFSVLRFLRWLEQWYNFHLT